MTTPNPLTVTYHFGVWNDNKCQSHPVLQIKATRDLILCVGAKYLLRSPFFQSFVELDQSVDRTCSSKLELNFIAGNLRDIPPTTALELLRIVLFANYDWEAFSSDLLVLIRQPNTKLYPVLFLALYLCSEPVRENIYVHVADVIQKTLSTQEQLSPDTIALLELLLDQNRCLSFESPKNVSTLIRQLLNCKPAIWKKLAKNLQTSLGPEKAICLLLRTCERLLTNVPLPKAPERSSKTPTSTTKQPTQKRRRDVYLLNDRNPELSSSDED